MHCTHYTKYFTVHFKFNPCICDFYASLFILLYFIFLGGKVWVQNSPTTKPILYAQKALTLVSTCAKAHSHTADDDSLNTWSNLYIRTHDFRTHSQIQSNTHYLHTPAHTMRVCVCSAQWIFEWLNSCTKLIRSINVQSSVKNCFHISHRVMNDLC